MAVYLLHFDSKISHAQHYLGFAEDVEKRIEQHRKGSDAKIVQAFTQRRIRLTLARIWKDGDRRFERYLKEKYKSAARLCPICSGKTTGGTRLKGLENYESSYHRQSR